MGYTERTGSSGSGHASPASSYSRLEQPTPALLDALSTDLALPLGRGQFGAVYQVYYRDRNVAVKVVSLSGEASEQNQSRVREPRGVSILQSLRPGRHPNILHLEEAYEDEDNLYMVFPLATYSLAQLLAARGPPERQRALSFLIQIAEGLRYLHHGLEEPIVHRDLKPANVLVFDMEQPTRVCLCDFGIARHVGTNSTFFGQVEYLPPEARSEAIYTPAGYDARKIDVYSFGVVVVECLAGVKPYAQPSAILAPYSDALLDSLGAVGPIVPLLARACLAADAAARPSIDLVLIELLKLARGEGQRLGG